MVKEDVEEPKVVLTELSADELVSGGSRLDTSTGHTSASAPPIVVAEQLENGAWGKPAKAFPPQV